ncbi:hypothetical protein HDV57DRAFT_227768 [Trichoderma longibrachiatum]|uniref:Uncharacterized protein n=1 Tax=Trichoderma longibrachiatum ATCC 18648 TaxID=983965 RepID=A0A2T4BR42_TRILO|nr:hypothetical protein M440DRAFT_1141856 [Trichoderma longibrachiatum ATCC 18648]
MESRDRSYIPRPAMCDMALESSNVLTSGVSGDAELIELYDVEIRNSIPRSKEKKLSSRSSKSKGATITAKWACYSPAGWRCNASGSLRVIFGDAAGDHETLPRRVAPLASLSSVETERSCTSLTETGVIQIGPF